MTQEQITSAQLRANRRQVSQNTRNYFRRAARWWELEALRGYESSARSLEYAANMRWAAELAGLVGPFTWLELKAYAKTLESGNA